MVDEAKITEAGRRILGAAPPSTRVVLFGSSARGEANSRSDLDLLIIEPIVEDAADEAFRLRRALWGMRLAVDIVVVSEAEALRWRDVRGSLIHAALAEGRQIAA